MVTPPGIMGKHEGRAVRDAERAAFEVAQREKRALDRERMDFRNAGIWGLAANAFTRAEIAAEVGATAAVVDDVLRFGMPPGTPPRPRSGRSVAQAVDLDGAGGRIRTRDLLITNHRFGYTTVPHRLRFFTLEQYLICT